MPIKVKDDFRKNDLSLIPGGSEVTTLSKDGRLLVYDKVKNVERYCAALKKDPNIIEIRVNDEIYWKSN